MAYQSNLAPIGPYTYHPYVGHLIPQPGYPTVVHPQHRAHVPVQQPQQQQQQQQHHTPQHAHAIDPDLSNPPPEPHRDQSSSPSPGEDDHHQHGADPTESPSQAHTDTPGSVKRKPGRPKGSKTKKRRTDSTSISSAANPGYHPGAPMLTYGYPYTYQDTTQMAAQYAAAAAPAAASTSSATARVLPPVNYEEFQVRVLNMCMGFYDAATELIQSTPPHILNHSLAPRNQPSALHLLNDVRRACDAIMTVQTSSALGTSSSNSLNSSSYLFRSHQAAQPMPALSATPAPRPPATQISKYTPYRPTPGPFAQSPPAASQAPAVNTNSGADGPPATAHGPWTEAEEKKLERLAEQSRSHPSVAYAEGTPNWDWVCAQWGAGRSRHQILIKATTKGMKPTTTHPSRLERAKKKDEGAGMGGKADKAGAGGKRMVQQHDSEQEADGDGEGEAEGEADADAEGEPADAEGEPEGEELEPVHHEEPVLPPLAHPKPQVHPMVQVQAQANGKGKARELQPMPQPLGPPVVAVPRMGAYQWMGPAFNHPPGAHHL